MNDILFLFLYSVEGTTGGLKNSLATFSKIKHISLAPKIDFGPVTFHMLECPDSKIFKAATGGRKPGPRPPVLALSKSFRLYIPALIGMDFFLRVLATFEPEIAKIRNFWTF